MTSLKTFRATLPAAESELQICPPDCTEDHDAKWGQGGGSIRNAEKAKTAPPSDTREEETEMASKSDVTQGFQTKEAAAYTSILNAEGKTVARAYRRKGSVVLYFGAGSLDGVKVAKELSTSTSKDGEEKVTVNGGARALQAARTVLKKTGAAIA